MSEHETEPQEPAVEPDLDVSAPEPQDDDPDQTEGAEPGEEPAGPQEPAQEPAEGDEAAAQMRSEKELEKAFKSIDKLREHVASRLGVIMGEDAQALEPCPLCGDGMPGFVWPAGSVPIPPEKVGAVSVYIGLPDHSDLEDAKDATQCPDCKGHGVVLTHSLVPNFTTMTCSLCIGKGYKGTGVVIRPEVGVVVTTNGEQPAFTAPVETELPPEAESLKARGWLVIPPTIPVMDA